MEMVKVELDVPKDVLLAARIKEVSAAKELKKELAIYLFERKTLSFGKASQLAGMSKWDFIGELGRRKISLHYGVEDLEGDIRDLKRIERFINIWD